MELLRTLAVFYLAFSSTESVILNSEGQYENLVINIESNVKNLTFLNANKTMELMTSFSRFLCSKTEQRFIVKEVKVILPPDYTEETLDTNIINQAVYLDDETLTKEASIVVVSPDDSYQEPFLKTVNLGGCGQQGEKIHISPGLFGELNPFNRTLGHLLFHEWAHYRWGLFDEYGEDMDSPFYLTANKTIKPIACPANLKGWMLTSDLKPCGRNDKLLPQPGCQFHLEYRKPVEPLSSLLMGYAVNKKDEFCGGGKIEHNPSPLSPQNQKCHKKSAFDILNSHPDFQTTKIKTNKCEDPTKVTFLKRKNSANKTIIVIVYLQFKNRITILKIESALNLVKKYEALSNFTLIIKYGSESNLTNVTQEFSPPGATSADMDNKSIWIATDNNQHINRFSMYSGVHFLVPKHMEEGLQQDKNKIKGFPEELSVMEIANSFIEHVVKSNIPDDKVPIQIYNELFYNGDVRGSFILDINCVEALFIAIKVNISNENTTLKGSLSGPNGEVYGTSLNQSSLCSEVESDGSLMAFKICDGNWKTGKWSYEVSVSSNDSISVIVICRLLKKSLQVIPRLFTKSLENTGTFNASVKNNILVLAASVMYNLNPVLNASVYVDVNTHLEIEGGKMSIQLIDDGVGSDVTRNDGVYTNEFHNIKGNGYYSFSFGVKINETSEVLSHHQFLKTNDKVFGVGRNMNFPTFLIRDNSTLKNLTEMYGESKSEFFYEDLAPPKDETPKISIQKIHLEDQERKSMPLSMEVYALIPDWDLNAPGGVSDLKVANISYRSSFVTLEWTSVGDDGLSGTAEKIVMKFTTDGSEFPSRFHEPEYYMIVNDTNLMEGTLKPLSARTKHIVSVKVPLKEGSTYQEDAIYFFALMYWDEVGNEGLVSNVAYAFFKPAEYSEEIQEIISQQKSGFMIVLVFLFFIGFLGVVIIAIKCYQKHRHNSGFSHEQILKYTS